MPLYLVSNEKLIMAINPKQVSTVKLRPIEVKGHEPSSSTESIATRPRRSGPWSLVVLSGFVCLLSGLLSCTSFKEPDFRNVDNIRVGGSGNGSTTLSMNVHYYNPNNTRLKLKEAKGKAWLEGNFLGDFKMDTLVHIPARGEFSMPVVLDLDKKAILGNSLLSLLKKEVTIKMEGKAKVGKGIFFISYPIRYEGKQDLKKLLK